MSLLFPLDTAAYSPKPTSLGGSGPGRQSWNLHRSSAGVGVPSDRTLYRN
jgi:hypothetical protein